MIIQKGGNVTCLDSGVWRGSNASGRADALFFNELGLDCNDFWKLWRYPLMNEGIMSSVMWKDDNIERILELLNNIITIRSRAIQNASNRGEREYYRDSLSKNDGHSRVLSYVIQLRNLVRDNGTNFTEHVRWEEPEGPNSDFDITETEGYVGVLSEVGNLNPSEHGEKIDPEKERARASAASKGGKRKNKTRKKQLYIVPDKNETIWSSDFFGERQIVDFKSFVSIAKVDNLNSIKGKLTKTMKKEYGRRLKLQLKKHKPSRKRYYNKTKKKYNKKTIDKQINKMSSRKLENTYKFLLKNEKTKN